MVRISRQVQNRGRPYSSSSSSGFLVRHGRKLAVAVVALQGIRMLLGLGSGSRTPPGGGGAPMGVEESLRNSHIRIPKTLEGQNNQAGTSTQDLASLANDNTIGATPAQHNHNLEENNIHMHLPVKDKDNKDLDKDLDKDSSNEDMDTELKELPGGEDAVDSIHHHVLHKKGTGATNVGYVRDLIAERANPAFREAVVEEHDASQTVASMVQRSNVRPCLTMDGNHRHQIQAPCLDPDTPQIAYNNATFSRIWCGQEIAPQTAVLMNEHCKDATVHLFPIENAPVSGIGMHPMIVRGSNDKSVDESDLEDVADCNIPCKQEKGMTNQDRYFDGEPWQILQTWADPFNSNVASMERTNYRHDKFYSTQSFESHIPLSHYSFDKYSFRQRPPVDFDSTIPKAVYMVDTLCSSQGSRRHKYFSALKLIYPIDSLGRCDTNAEVPEGMTLATLEGRISIMKQYRFVLAADPVTEKDYITPLIWEAFLAGSVPIVLGAQNIREHVPPNSYIDALSFGSTNGWDNLAVEVKRLSEHKEDWEKYHAWRTDEAAIAKMEAMYEFTKTNMDCRLCRWGYAKKYGLGWDHAKQQVVDPHVPRQLCMTSTHGLASKPFAEEWIGRQDIDEHILKREDSENESCGSMAFETSADGGSFKFHRKVVQHDGVTDILISDIERQSIDEEVVLRLRFAGMRNPEGAHFVDTHTSVPNLIHSPLVSSASIQDDFVKVTVLADWVTTIWSPMEGSIEITIQKAGEGPLEANTPKRIRVISEDMHLIDDKMTEFFPSSFGKKMTEDFVDPLEIFYPGS